MVEFTNKRVYLAKDFQKKIFVKLLNKFGSQRKASQKIKLSQAEFHYLLFGKRKSMLWKTLEEICQVLEIDPNKVKKYVMKVEEPEDYRKRCIKAAHLKKKKASKLMVNIKEVFDGRVLDILKLIQKSGYLEQLKRTRGLVVLTDKPSIRNGKIFLPLRIYIPQKNDYISKTISIPTKINFNIDFMYFLGLIFGDGTSMERFGVINTNLNLLKFATDFIKRFFSQEEIRGTIHIHDQSLIKNIEEYKNNLKSIGVKEIDVVEMYEGYGTIVYTIYATNQTLSKIMYFVMRNLVRIWPSLSFNLRGAFLAGIFDTEGNVNKWDGNLRISQKTKEKKRIIEYILKTEGYNFRYDGDNFVIGNLEKTRQGDFKRFKKQILPHMKHDEKIRNVKEMFSGNFLYPSFKEVLKAIAIHNGITHDELARKLNRIKCRRELKALEMINYITKSGYPFKYFITKEGLKWIRSE